MERYMSLRTPHKRSLLCTAISLSLLPLVSQSIAQEEVVEEVVVTGSYIRNSAFAEDTNVNTVTQAELFESGAPSMANYIRDLPFTQNTNMVTNTLGSGAGAQTGVGTTFNLRGLGENSTLQLVDGVRVIDQAINSTLPDIAIARLEVVLDGGSAIYGSDAVAGVVNIIPIKEFDGFRARSYYQRDEKGNMEEMNASALWGKSFGNGVSYVGAFDARTRTPLMQYERPREWAKDNGSSSSGNPGVWREVVGADASINLNAIHNGSQISPSLVDPTCGTFNEGSPAHGQGKYPTPSGVLTNNGNICRMEYSAAQEYSPEETLYNLYNSLTWEPTEWLELNLSLKNSVRVNDARASPSTAVSSNNRAAMIVRADHPNNPWGVDVGPRSWRMIGFTEDAGSRNSAHSRSLTPETTVGNNQLMLHGAYDLAGSWTGYSYYSRAERKVMEQSETMHLGRLQLAFEGMGGNSGDQYWNPFGTADSRAPGYIEGVTNNPEGLADWVNQSTTGTRRRDYLDIFETSASGDLFDLPAGSVRMAAGFQSREVEERRFADPLAAIGHDYNASVTADFDADTQFFSTTRAVFLEVEVPVLETVDVQLAVRHEEFTTFGLAATTPKVAVRWEALPTLALRASWGESFLAPTPTQSRPFVRSELCAEIFSGTDQFLDVPMTGGTRCASGNPNLAPETSEMTNFGFTWSPTGRLDGLEISVDYQEIEYQDRIRTLTEQDTVAFTFQNMLADTGIAESAYDATPGSATRAAAEAWLTANPNSGGSVERAADFRVDTVFRQAQNISSVFINLFDTRVSYSLTTDNWGTFSSTLATSIFDGYDYQELGGTALVDALGNQNGNTGIVPPIPKYKSNLRLNWFKGNQSASINTNYWHNVMFDDRVFDNYGDGWIAPRTIESETRVNAQYAIVIDDFFNSEFTISGGVNNLFDRRPQRLPVLGGFESRLSTPWGRQFWLSLDWTPSS